MNDLYRHEAEYRDANALAKLATVRLTLCGAGALGSHLADNLVRQGFRDVAVVDRDRVEAHNAGTQLYGESDVGAWKVDVLKQRIFRATGIEIEAHRKELTERTAKSLLCDGGLVIDAFDNSASRQLVQDQCRARGLTCLHVGLNADYGEIVWDERYRVPRDVGGDACDYPLARNLVLLVVAVASEVLVRFALEGIRSNYSVTLRDFAVQAFEG